MITPIVPDHQLDHPGVVKIALGLAASDALKGLGKHLLILAAPADSTAPAEAQGRMVLHCLPITKELADDSFAVATGKMRAVTPRASAGRKQGGEGLPPPPPSRYS